jgi:hypothetical protein
VSKHSNPGIVDVERAAEGILDSGGGMTSRQKDDHIHNTVYSKDENRRLSWDEYSDGSIKDVHTSKNGRSDTEYGNGK